MNFNEMSLPYTIIATYIDGKRVLVNTPMSLSVATRLVEKVIKEKAQIFEAIEIVDNYTGEIAYSVKANIRTEVDFEIYDPYNA